MKVSWDDEIPNIWKTKFSKPLNPLKFYEQIFESQISHQPMGPKLFHRQMCSKVLYGESSSDLPAF